MWYYQLNALQLSLPVENVMGLGLQQDVQVHASTDHLGGSFH